MNEPVRQQDLRVSDAERSVVASCDVYELRHGRIARITSYTVELEAEADG